MDTIERAPGAEAELLYALIATQTDFSSGAIEPRLLLESLVGRAQVLSGASGATLELVDGEEIVCQVGTGTASELTGRRSGQGGVGGMVARTGMLLRCVDTQTDERVDEATASRLDTQSLVAAPVYHDGGFAGALTVVSPAADAFDDPTVQSIQVIAGLMGMAMSRLASSGESHPAMTTTSLELVQYQGLHDTLTELPSRTLLFDRLGQAIQLAHREREPLAVLSFDLDFFSRVNDTLGRDAGDAVLQAAANCLRGTLRASDTIARTGGDEFAVVLPGANAIGALGTAHKLLRSLMHDTSSPERRGIAATIGIAIYPEHGDEADLLLEHADEALQQARREGESHRVYGG
jgi:diguanylate cyclase